MLAIESLHRHRNPPSAAVPYRQQIRCQPSDPSLVVGLRRDIVTHCPDNVRFCSLDSVPCRSHSSLAVVLPLKVVSIRQRILLIPLFAVACRHNFAIFKFVTFLRLSVATMWARLNPSSPKGVVPTPLTVFALVLKIAQPRGKIAQGTFKFIFSLHFSEKNSEPTTYTGGRVSFQSWIFWKYLKWYALTSLFAS